MNIPLRWMVAAAVLFFSFGGQSYLVQPTTVDAKSFPLPEGGRPWVQDLKPLLPKMTLADRHYLRDIYTAMAIVLDRDARNDPPSIDTTGRFAKMHSMTLGLAIDLEKVGKTPGLGEAIDKSFERAAGLDDTRIDEAKRKQLTDACRAIAWAFNINSNE